MQEENRSAPLPPPRSSSTKILEGEEEAIEKEIETENDEERKERLQHHMSSVNLLHEANLLSQDHEATGLDDDHDDLLDTEDENVKRLISHSLKKSTKVRENDLQEFLRSEITRRANLEDIPITLLFVFLLGTSLLSHISISDSGLIQRSLRGMIEGTTYEGVHFSSGHKDITSIDTKEDVYTFLREAFLPTFLNPLGTAEDVSEQSRVLRYSRLVGGVQIQQLRRDRRMCEQEYDELGPKTLAGWCTGETSFAKERCRQKKSKFDCDRAPASHECIWEDGPRNPMLVDRDCFPWYSESKACFAPEALINQAQAVPVGWCPDSMDLPRVWLGNDTIGTNQAHTHTHDRRALQDSEKNILNAERGYHHRHRMQTHQRAKREKLTRGNQRSKNTKGKRKTTQLAQDGQRRKKSWLPRSFQRFREWFNNDTAGAKRRSLLSQEKALLGGKGTDYAGPRPGATTGNGEPFSIYMYEHKGLEAALQKLSELEKFGWIDDQTAWIGIRILVFCPELAMFVHVTTMVHFTPAGELIPDLKALSFTPDPYSNPGTILCDVCWVLMLFIIVVRHILSLYRAAQQRRGDGSCRRVWTSAYQWIDLMTCLGGLVVMISWISVLDKLKAVNAKVLDVALHVPTPVTEIGGFPTMLAELHNTAAVFSEFMVQFNVIATWYLLFLIPRLFEAFSGQPRLGVVTNTFSKAVNDLIHFFILWSLITVSYAVAGMFTFGRRVYTFSSFGLACEKAVVIGLLGEFDWEELGFEHPVTAGIWFWTFIVLNTFILVNMIMAIVMDVYMDVKNDVSESDQLWVTAIEFWRDWRLIRKKELVDPRELLEKLKAMKVDNSLPSEIDQEFLQNIVFSSRVQMPAEQASKLIYKVRELELKELRGSTQLSSTMVSIGWIKIALQKMGEKVNEILMGEEEEKHFLEVAAGMVKTSADEQQQRLKSSGPFVEQGSVALGELQDRTERFAQYMNEAMDYTLYRGKDLRNRLAVIEGQLRSRQQNKLTYSEEQIWDQAPPYLGNAPQIQTPDVPGGFLKLGDANEGSRLQQGSLALRDLSLDVGYDPMSNQGSPPKKIAKPKGKSLMRKSGGSSAL